MGATQRNANLSPERRKEIASKAWLASAVNAVINKSGELSEDQVARLRTAFAEAV